jgi:hypothetical protein
VGVAEKNNLAADERRSTQIKNQNSVFCPYRRASALIGGQMFFSGAS